MKSKLLYIGLTAVFIGSGLGSATVFADEVVIHPAPVVPGVVVKDKDKDKDRGGCDTKTVRKQDGDDTKTVTKTDCD